MVALLDRTEALASHGLFFEVHELLEPVWFRAPEPQRTALQGLIQVAVAFHHLENRNREGARSLLTLGVAKLTEAGSALPLETRAWLDRLRATLASLARGQDPPLVPRWPAPARSTS
jgi:predicted metal-dependent hydrolase